MRKFSIARAVTLTLTLGLSGLAGCELFVDFDRSDIDGGSLDLPSEAGCFGTTCDASAPVDATMDSSVADATMDTSDDTTIQDTGSDTAVADANDAGTDAGLDAADSTVPDADVPDANEAGADADDGASSADADDGSTSDAADDAGDDAGDADPDAGD